MSLGTGLGTASMTGGSTGRTGAATRGFARGTVLRFLAGGADLHAFAGRPRFFAGVPSFLSPYRASGAEEEQAAEDDEDEEHAAEEDTEDDTDDDVAFCFLGSLPTLGAFFRAGAEADGALNVNGAPALQAYPRSCSSSVSSSGWSIYMSFTSFSWSSCGSSSGSSNDTSGPWP